MGLAAVFGRDLYDQSIMIPDDPRNKPWNDAIRETAEHFATPVRDMDELIARMRELFPTENTDQQQFSAFNIIQQTGLFNNQGKTIACLVINGTKYFFEAYGKALREDTELGDYGYDFREAILSQSAKAQRTALLAEAAERAAWQQRRRNN